LNYVSKNEQIFLLFAFVSHHTGKLYKGKMNFLLAAAADFNALQLDGQ
jgi:hypothetical protein